MHWLLLRSKNQTAQDNTAATTANSLGKNKKQAISQLAVSASKNSETHQEQPIYTHSTHSSSRALHAEPPVSPA